MGLIQNKVKVSQPVSHIIIENAGGLQGPAGAPGEPGPQGEPGVPGQDGKDGTAATIAVGSTTTLPAGSQATVTNSGTSSEAVFNFSIPKGDKGDKGDAGAGLVITGTVATYQDLPNDLTPADAGKAYFVEADGKLYVWSGTQFPAEGEGSQFEGPQGPAGQDGQAATITAGTTTTLPAGSSATVTNSGTTSAAVFNFGIPAGADGATGPAGPANTLSIGTVQGGDTAAATITGTAPNQTLNLTLPKGDQGDPGPEPELFRNVTGTNIELTDAGSSVKSLNYIYGDTEQDTYSGKNLLDVFAFMTVGNTISSNGVDMTLNADGTITISGTATGGNSQLYITNSGASLPAANNKVVMEMLSGTISGGESKIWFYSFDNNFVGTAVASLSSVGIASGACNVQTATQTRFRFTVIEGVSVNCKVRVMFESQSYDNTYEPYVGGTASPNPDYPQEVQTVTGEQTITISDGNSQSQSYTVNLGSIELCKIGTYQDYIYKSGDDWYIHKEVNKVVFDGSEDWARNSYESTYYYRLTDIVIPAQTSGYSNYFAIVPSSVGIISQRNAIRVQNNQVDLIKDGSNVSLADFKTWLGSHNTSVYYVLATATDTQITDATLISQLNALDSATLYNGNTYIQVTSTDLPGELDLDYWTYFHRNVETVDIEDGAVTTPKVANGAITPAKMDYPEFDNKTIWFNEATVSNTVGGYTQTTIDSKQVTFKAGRYFIFVPFSVNRTAGTSTELALNITFTGTGLYASNLGGRVPAISGYSFTARSGILIVPSDQTITVNYTYGAQNAGGAFTTTQFYAALIRIANS